MSWHTSRIPASSLALVDVRDLDVRDRRDTLGTDWSPELAIYQLRLHIRQGTQSGSWHPNRITNRASPGMMDHQVAEDLSQYGHHEHYRFRSWLCSGFSHISNQRMAAILGTWKTRTYNIHTALRYSSKHYLFLAKKLKTVVTMLFQSLHLSLTLLLATHVATLPLESRETIAECNVRVAAEEVACIEQCSNSACITGW